MATVDKNSANWRLFGGGGLLVGGVFWLVAILVELAAPGVIGTWLGIIGLLLVGIGLFIVALGETGSNGAVGASLFGKVSVLIFGLGWLLFGVLALLAVFGVALPAILTTVAGVLVVVGGILATFVIWQAGVARGAAKWIMAVPAVFGILYVISALGWVTISGWWLGAVLALAFAVTGLLYLLNSKNVG